MPLCNTALLYFHAAQERNRSYSTFRQMDAEDTLEALLTATESKAVKAAATRMLVRLGKLTPELANPKGERA